jgi:hypothetical protein
MRRKQLSIRARTTVCQNLPAVFEEKLSTFRKYCQDKVNDYSIHPDHVINMDEVPLTFDLPMNRTVEKTGSSTISIKTTGHKKASFTCVLACTASGIHLPPMFIFKRNNAERKVSPWCHH